MNNQVKTKLLEISEKSVQASVIPKGRDTLGLFDTRLKGFGVEKTRAGEMTYFISFFIEAGQLSKWRLGEVGEISTQTARERAITILNQVEKCKGCPIVDSCGQFLPAKEENTVYLPIPTCASFNP